MLHIRPLPEWDGFTPQWIEASGAHWLSKGAAIYRAGALGAPPGHVATVPTPKWKRALCRLPYVERVLRFSVYNLIPRSDGSLFVTFAKSLFVWQDGIWHQIEGLAHPFRVLRGCAAQDGNGTIYFGAYFSNADRASKVEIYAIEPGSTRAETVRTFQPGQVRHVHGIHTDPVTGALWSLTGDLPDECRIERSKDGFASTEMIGTGDESWRGIHPQFTQDAIYYATDAEFDQNHIYRIDRASGARTPVTQIDGPSYYGATVGDHVVFATTAELCPSQKGKDAQLWAIGPDGAPQNLRAWRKDLFANRRLMQLGQAGIVQFASSEGPVTEMPFTGTGLKGLNNRMFVLSSA